MSLTDVLNLCARASGLHPMDPEERRRMRRRRSSSSSAGGMGGSGSGNGGGVYGGRGSLDSNSARSSSVDVGAKR